MSQEAGKGKVLAIDFGQKRIGLAISDETRTFAFGLDTLLRKSNTLSIQSIHQLCQDRAVSQIVLGLPRNMDGSEGPQAERVRDFAQELETVTALPVHLLDERLTSVLAQRLLKAQGVQPSRHKGKVDEEAARQILQNYLDKF